MIFKPATCKCGHKGKSKKPEYYQCGACYYTARAAWNRQHAQKLRERARKLEEEAVTFDGQREAFQRRHPEAGKPG